jgi:pSer/pThr/pTyr-binding forkhead associated (FHA) protein
MADEAKTARIRRAPGNGAHEEPYLIVLAGGPAGMMYKLRFDTAMVIGRGLHADIRLEDEGVSRRHVQVTASRDGNPVLEDLGSSNGTFVNGRRSTTRNSSSISLPANTPTPGAIIEI